jgi:purine nucleosidase
MAARPLIIDCDPGVDDAIALFLAFACPEDLDILAITTVVGNVAGALTARNACIIREMAGREDVPVFEGCAAPMVRAPVDAGQFHGATGLGPLPIFAPKKSIVSDYGVHNLLHWLLHSPPGSVTLAVTGPMTNIAAVFDAVPDAAAGVREIVVMGGARSEGGNITASAEYNIYADPHAAQIVFASGAPITVFGLDATHQVRSTPARIEALHEIGTPQAIACADLLQFSADVERNIPGITGAPLHDPCTIAYLLKPELFDFLPCFIEVETEGKVALGHTAVEFRDAGASKTRWATRADGEGVFNLLIDRLSQ